MKQLKSKRGRPPNTRHECQSLGSHLLRFIKGTHIILINDCPIELTPLEYRAFRMLLAQPRMVVLDRELAKAGEAIGPRMLERHIDNVRRKLRQSGISGLNIVRVISYGYVLLPDQEKP